ncbi:hypothetical protein B0H19DRAFT_1245850 [Mycena capillaripes]|nr:hypothetical protein B0H19DRAFT_1245850 [Mycena capillaripes]
MPTTTARSLARKIDVKYDSKTFARFTYRKACNLQLLKALEIIWVGVLSLHHGLHIYKRRRDENKVAAIRAGCIIKDFNGEQDSEDRAAPILPISTSGLDALHPSVRVCSGRSLEALSAARLLLNTACHGPILDGEPAPTSMQLHLNPLCLRSPPFPSRGPKPAWSFLRWA